MILMWLWKNNESKWKWNWLIYLIIRLFNFWCLQYFFIPFIQGLYKNYMYPMSNKTSWVSKELQIIIKCYKKMHFSSALTVFAGIYSHVCVHTNFSLEMLFLTNFLHKRQSVFLLESSFYFLPQRKINTSSQ